MTSTADVDLDLIERKQHDLMAQAIKAREDKAVAKMHSIDQELLINENSHKGLLAELKSLEEAKQVKSAELSGLDDGNS